MHLAPGTLANLPSGLNRRSGIIQTLNLIQKLTMEAERINAIGNQIADLAQRGAELRRYL